MEREKTFEDDNIILWRDIEPASDPAPDPNPDPTVIGIKAADEEAYESRVYAVTELHDPSGRLPSRRTPAPLRELLIRLSRVPDSGFKILAKRARADGRISFLLVMTNGDNRFLLAKGDRVEESQFRSFVADLETDLLASGVVAEPLVITVDQWRAYQRRMGET